MAFVVESHHHQDEKPHDEEGDDDDDNGDERMKGRDLMHDRGGGVLEAHLPRRGLAIHGMGGAAE